MSDHYATVTNMETPTLPSIPPLPPRWNQDLAGWHTFQNKIEQWATNYEIPANIDLFEEHVIIAFHNAADKSMPKRANGNFTFKDSWYYCEEVRMLKTRLNRVRKLHKRRPTQENLELLITGNHDTQQRLANIRSEKCLLQSKY